MPSWNHKLFSLGPLRIQEEKDEVMRSGINQKGLLSHMKVIELYLREKGERD